nr:helix-turn-helix domain-containing protein [Limosilactobacillus mucosae]
MTEYMTLKTAMKYLGICNYGTLREYIAAGLPVIKVGRSKRISKTAIDKFMAEHQTAATSETGQSKGA